MTIITVAFSAHIDEHNPDIQKLVTFAAENEVTTGKFTIGDEKKMNVFMRLDSAAVLGTFSSLSIDWRFLEDRCTRSKTDTALFWDGGRFNREDEGGYRGGGDGKLEGYEGALTKTFALA